MVKVNDLVVSFTSYPPRIKTAHLLVNNLLSGEYVPGLIVLNLAIEEFPDKVLPDELTNLIGDNFKINWVRRNTYTFKKILPIVHDYSDKVLMCVDDDIAYPSNYVKSFWEHYKLNGENHVITFVVTHAFTPLGRGILFPPGVLNDYNYYLTDEFISSKNDDKFIELYLLSRLQSIAPITNIDPIHLEFMDYKSGWDQYTSPSQSPEFHNKYLAKFTMITNQLIRFRSNIEFVCYERLGYGPAIKIDPRHYNYWDNW